MKIILLCKSEFSSAAKTSFFIKNTKNNRSTASDWSEYNKYCFKENAMILSKNSTTQDLVLKRMLELFLTVLPLNKILQFQERICFFFLKTQKNNLFSIWLMGKSKSSFKENARTFSKSSTTQEFQNPKNRLWNLYKIKPKIKPMIEKLRDELYQ